tara:strand:+ start:145 stop:354 length:210 start_codon:yes stop_codon:yes gene_type:complete
MSERNRVANRAEKEEILLNFVIKVRSSVVFLQMFKVKGAEMEKLEMEMILKRRKMNGCERSNTICRKNR